MTATAEVLIQKTPGVIGGAACIRSTRIGVHMLVRKRKFGMPDSEIVDDYYAGFISLQDLDAAWDYYQHHRDEIDARIREDEEAD